MKRIAILMGLALLADVEPALAQGARGGSHATSVGRPSISGYTGRTPVGYAGQTPVGYTGKPVAVVQGNSGHRPGHPNHGHHHHGHHHHHHPIGVVFPWWWYHYYPVYVPTYVPIPVPAPEPSSNLRYYCPDYRDYYPNVGTCPSQWLQVVPPVTAATY